MVLGDSTGGIGAHVDRLSQDLEAAGHEVVIATSESTATAFDWAGARRLWPVHRGWSAPRGLVDWHLLKNLAGTVDVVHAHGHQAAFVAAVAVARAKPRPGLVVSLHNTVPGGVATRPVGGGATRGVGGGATRGVGGGATRGVGGGATRGVGGGATRGVVAAVVRTLLRWALGRATLVTGASADLVDLARRLGAARAELATVASPAVERILATSPPDDRERRAARVALRAAGHSIDDSRPLVLTIARVAPQKDLVTLVAAARAARAPATWVVVGGGDERLRASLESELSGIPLRFVGAQRDVEHWLRAADVFVLTSRWEARALVVQEAMASGLPVVTTRTGGLPDLVGDAGLLVPVGDSTAVAEAVDAVLGDHALRERLGAAARARAGTWASPEEEARRWVSRYTAALHS
ncbi:hypothetical protein IDVR_24270 [Intrasporangium sp. DVR]